MPAWHDLLAWNGLALLVALILDARIGDPAWLWSRVAHPVVVIGRGVGWADARFNSGSDAAKRAAGLTLVVTLCAVIGLLAGLISWGLRHLPLGWLLEGVLGATLIAQRSLYEHVERVLRELLQRGLPAARTAVGMIVGRDTSVLDTGGVVRAATESLAENFSDAVVAPAFWFLVGGLPGLAVYKAINTMDSMIGHLTPRHSDFGRAAAKLDDAVNWLPARLSGALIVLAAWPRRAMPRAAWRAMREDAAKHSSPNAGWPEAAMAGAMNVALAGPRRYGERTEDGAWMNAAGRRDLRAGDLRSALDLFTAACLLLGVAVGLATLMLVVF